MAEKLPITVDDLHRITTLEDPRISPDGQWIAYVQVTIDRMDNAYKRSIWLISTAGGKPLQITRSGKDYEPRWSPDGNMLAFVSSRDKKPQIYLLRMTAPAGEARPLTSLPNGASNIAWSQDSSRITFLSRLNAAERAYEASGEEASKPKDKLDAKQRGERKEQEETERWDPRLIWRIPYRTGTSYLDDRFSQVYVMPVDEDSSSEEAKPRRLTDFDANHDQPQWTPDGDFLLTARNTQPDVDQAGRYTSLFRIDVGSGEHEQLTGDGYTAFAALPSPNGQWIAYSRLEIHDRFTEQIVRLAIMPADGGEIRDLNMELNRNTGDYRWSADSKALFFSMENEGRTQLYRVNPASGETTLLVDAVQDIGGFDYGADGRFAYAASTVQNPSELYLQPADSDEAVQLTQVNKAFLESVIVQDIHEFGYESENGLHIQGWYILPVGYQGGQQYPLVVNIHGGPHTMWGAPTQSIWHENQSFAAAGYGVFYCNPRGSGGYGQDFQMALHGDWGNPAQADVMAGLEAVIEKGFVDVDRLVVTGGSYGGYLTSWIVGHDDRFKAAASQRGVYNLLSFFGTTDIPLFLKEQWGLEPWDNPMQLWENSPIAHAHKIKTPLLILHSENDFRVAVSEGEQMFAYVRRSGGTTKFVRFPREGHELSRSGEPAHRASRLNHIIDWFKTYCPV